MLIITPSFSQSHKIDSLVQILSAIVSDTSKVKILLDLSSQLYSFGSYGKSMDYALMAEKLSAELDFKKGGLDANIRIGLIYKAQANYPKALEFFSKAQQIGSETGDTIGVVSAINSIGLTHYYIGNYTKALDFHLKALRINEEIGNKKGVYMSYANMGLIYEAQKENAKALEFYFKALDYFEETSYKQGVYSELTNIGNVYNDMEDYSKALEFYSSALKMAEELGHKSGMSVNYINIGNIYLHRKSYDGALEYYLKALEISKELGEKQFEAGSLNNIGSLYLQEKKYKEALMYSNESLKISKSIGVLALVKDTEEILYRIYKELNDSKNALLHYEAYITARDSAFNEENTKKLVRSEMNYEFEKKQAEAKFEQEKRYIEVQLKLQKQNQVIYILAGAGLLLMLTLGLIVLLYRQNKLKTRQQNMELQQKLLRTQMNPHFIFNALMSIQSFIYENEPKEAGVYLSRFAKLMRMILESSNEEYILLNKELITLENYLELQKLRFENRFNYIIETTPDLNTETVLIPPMLTQPFIENALEHGLQNADNEGFIKIAFGFSEKHVTIEVQDNGIGRERAAVIKKESKILHRSMAMEISKERLSILNKGHKRKITLDVFDLKDSDNAPAGTRVIFTIPFKKIDV